MLQFTIICTVVQCTWKATFKWTELATYDGNYRTKYLSFEINSEFEKCCSFNFNHLKTRSRPENLVNILQRRNIVKCTKIPSCRLLGHVKLWMYRVVKLLQLFKILKNTASLSQCILLYLYFIQTNTIQCEIHFHTAS